MKLPKLQLIQCGVGGSGAGWLQNHTLQSPNFDVAAIVDLDEKQLEAAQKRCGIARDRCFTSLEKALEAGFPCDAILTVTPPHVHVQHARLALTAGKHLLTEKPIATNLSEAQEMIALAKSMDRQLAVSQNYRFRPGIQTLRGLLEREELGSLGHGHLDFYIPSDFTGSFREGMEYPLLIDMAIHHFDLIRCLTQRDIVKITAWSFRPSWSWYRHQPSAKAVLELEDGILFSYSADWSARGRSTSWNGNWRLQCERGSLHFENDHVLLARSEQGTQHQNETMEEIEISPLKYAERSATLHHFAQAIKTGKTIEISGERNLNSFAAVVAAIQSTQQGVSIELEKLLRDTSELKLDNN